MVFPDSAPVWTRVWGTPESGTGAGARAGAGDTRRTRAGSEARHGVSNGDHYYQEQQQQYLQHSCACLTNPAAGNALIGLTNQLQNTAAVLRQLPEHNASRTCVILRRVTELNDIMQ